MTTNLAKRQFWQEHVEQWRASELSQKSYCEQHHLKPHLLAYWKQKLESVTQTPELNNFVAVATENSTDSGLHVLVGNSIQVSGLSSIGEVVALVSALR